MNWLRNSYTGIRPQQKPLLPPSPPPTPPQEELILELLPIPTVHSCGGHRPHSSHIQNPYAPSQNRFESAEAAETITTGARYYKTNPQRRGVLGHISFGVRSYNVSKAFYTAVFAPLGVIPIYDNPILTTTGYGYHGDVEVFNIFEYSKAARAPGRGSHLAFNAPTRKSVRDFWQAGCRNGGKDDGPPGVREEYGAFYYAAFIIDPDGFKLEAVCQEEDGEP